MKRFLLVGILAFSIPARGQQQVDCTNYPDFYRDPTFMSCTCDPGQSKAANGSVRCTNCLTFCSDVVPQIACSNCEWARPTWAPVCKGCTIQYPPSTEQGSHSSPGQSR